GGEESIDVVQVVEEVRADPDPVAAVVGADVPLQHGVTDLLRLLAHADVDHAAAGHAVTGRANGEPCLIGSVHHVVDQVLLVLPGVGGADLTDDVQPALRDAGYGCR